MKRTVLAILATILLALPSSAQIKFGIQGGLNINKFSMDTDVIKSSNQAGFYIGPTFLIGCPIFDVEVAGIYDVRRGEVDGKSLTEQNVNVQANWKNSDFSINLGGGVKINHVEIRVNYNSALGKTADAEFNPTIDSDGIHLIEPKSNAWQIGATYYF